MDNHKLKEIMINGMNEAPFKSKGATGVHKVCVYEAFLNLLEESPDVIHDYLVFGKRDVNLQAKLFQKYISFLEAKIPFKYIVRKKLLLIDSLLSENLCLFDGISVFEGVVSDKKEIKNGTKEFYVGGRAGFHAKPFYMGKILKIINMETQENILSDIESHSFLRIHMKTTLPGTRVKVSHLRVPPHYQMGGMSYINRIRQDLILKIKCMTKS
jgi:hypothetical protein